MELKNFIRIFDNTHDLKIIGSFIKYLNTVKFEEAKIIESHTKPDIIKKKTRAATTFPFHIDEKNLSKTHWYNYWCNFFTHYHIEYQSLLTCRTESSGISSVEALQYDVGGKYVIHTDYHLKFPRNISIIYFLNDDYKGGELNFHNPQNRDEIYQTVKPKSGRMIVWPSNFLYPHSVNNVTEGKRFVLVSWFA
mgnify:FL=1